MGQTKIIICSKKACLGAKIDLVQIREYFENKGYQVFIYSNFCEQIKNKRELTIPGNDSPGPVVFAGCSPLVMENRIKILFDVPVEMANIREQCAWAYEQPHIADRRCKEIIALAINQVKFTKPFTSPKNILKEKLSQYLAVLERCGPNPFQR